jgi:hypothetical protein
MFRGGASVTVTAQWSLNNPTIYVAHSPGRDFVDLAISGSHNNDVVVRFQLGGLHDVLTVGHNLISAGLSLARTLGVDIDQLKAATPSVWWPQESTS